MLPVLHHKPVALMLNRKADCNLMYGKHQNMPAFSSQQKCPSHINQVPLAGIAFTCKSEQSKPSFLSIQRHEMMKGRKEKKHL